MVMNIHIIIQRKGFIEIILLLSVTESMRFTSLLAVV